VILLDTDTCVAIMRGHKSALHRMMLTGGTGAISAMTVSELFYGAEWSAQPEKNRLQVENFLLTVAIIPIDLPIARKFGRIKATLKKTGELLPDADILIAATALVYGTPLVTGNTRHFTRFHDLSTENWLQ